MAEPRIPDVGSSPLLNRKVVEKQIVDPLYAEPQLQSQPQSTPPQPPQPQPTPQPTPQPSQPFNPQNFVKDQTTEHLTNPQTPLYDPNVRTMSFDDMDKLGSGDNSGGGGSGGGSGGDSTIQLPKGEAKALAKVIVQVGSAYIPMLLSKFACINISELEILETEQAVPPGSVALFQRINQNTELALQISEDEQKMLLDAIKAYLEWKNIESANPGTALAIALGAVVIRLGITTVQSMSQNKAMYREFLNKHYQPVINTISVDESQPTNTKEQEA